MKKTILAISILIGLTQIIYGQNTNGKNNSYGILFMAGGRYDNLRMCVASPSGAKGGPIADIMFITKHKITNNRSITFNLPIMRPILFGLAFSMVQFEPEVTLEHQKFINEKSALILGPGIGVSFHWGPDYKSNLSNPGKSFFAIGPFISWQTGIAFKKEGVVKSVAGLKAFYTPLLAKDRPLGTVLGGALFFTYYL